MDHVLIISGYRTVVAHWTLGTLCRQGGEWTSARTHLEQAIALYDPHHPRGSADLTALTLQGQEEEGIPQMCQGFATHRAIGAETELTRSERSV